jgi:hypothetical protein
MLQALRQYLYVLFSLPAYFTIKKLYIKRVENEMHRAVVFSRCQAWHTQESAEPPRGVTPHPGHWT